MLGTYGIGHRSVLVINTKKKYGIFRKMLRATDMDCIPSAAAYFAIMEAFPLPIARALLEGRRPENVSKQNVSLLFSDIVGFTSMSRYRQARFMHP